MEIKFKKDSPDGKHKKGSTAKIGDWRAKYWINVGVAEEVVKENTTTKKKKAPAKAENKNAAPKTENK